MRKRKRLKITQEQAEMLEALRQKFIEKFGREPGPDDPVFFDPDADTPQPISEEKLARHLAEAAAAAGIEPEKIYAMLETGLSPTQSAPAKAKREFKKAMDKYRKLPRQ